MIDLWMTGWIDGMDGVDGWMDEMDEMDWVDGWGWMDRVGR